MVRDLLAGGGIPARVRADDVGALHPELGQVGSHSGITLMVDEHDAGEARDLLAAYAADVAEDGSTAGLADGRSDDSRAEASDRRGVRYVALLTIGVIVGGLLVAFGIDALAVWG